MMNIPFKVASLMLSYPTRELQQEIPNLINAIQRDQSLSDQVKDHIITVAEDIAGLELYDAQERYVYLFDRTRSLSLHLFEHVHGESRDRGQAMVDLRQMYEQAHFEIGAKELPDYLPLFLEFLSVSEPPVAAELLSQINHLIVVLKTRLHKRDSIYAHVFCALESMTPAEPEQELVNELLAHPEDDPEDLEALDSIWQEDPVSFSGNVGDNACGLDRIRVQARAAQRKPQDPAGSQSHLEV